jgi:hypothetical protein
MKLTIPKCTLATRQRVQSWLSAQGKDALMPTVRVTSDAMRVATSYVLRDWAHWQGKDGTVYKATSVALTHPKGLSLHIHVQSRRTSGVQSIETLCTLWAQDGATPQRIAHNTSAAFRDLFRALEPQKLLRLGQDHLCDVDLRILAESLFEGSIDKLWPGVWLCLTDAPALEEVQALGTMLVAGSLSLSVLTLDTSASNLATVADELAKESIGHLEGLTRRLELPKPRLEGIEREYRALCRRIRNAEERLGVQIPCVPEQVTFEDRFASALR